jgi:hypothetical protein
MMTEDEAWDDLEARIKRQNDAKQVADVTDLIYDAVALERTSCAEQYRKIMDDAIRRAILREREACAKFVEERYCKLTPKEVAQAIRRRTE